jgi:hypothetical protein
MRDESRAIREHLAGEAGHLVTAEDLNVLTSSGARAARSIKTLAAGRLENWGAQKLLQNRMVQLALAKQRLAGAQGEDARVRAASEVERLRAAIVEIRPLVGGAR